MTEIWNEVIKPLLVVLAVVLLGVLIVLGIIATFMSVFGPTDEQRAAARIPVAISQADGCTVYRFEDSGTHYFTRCGERVTTTRNYTENCGKGCVRNRQEHLTTDGNK